ncbi:RING-H2 finger protein ATL57-like [Amborella trichopoda]|uniref:RING-type E3 ubiquitin transferase n=1 Tax=Amborella trichopoda TaxID=13333 RepID=W1P4K3_AMBTC|nr:RING-H2 finger protein ATL57-like [Amborella trichopoda]ERN04797.1 hypothetical protein AMTR_s00140p00098680 [Amborella trichopoda]|eukprot:XP_020522123.1 RING-H2 finger protein ATL57-like [Amborella trichopoda]
MTVHHHHQRPPRRLLGDFDPSLPLTPTLFPSKATNSTTQQQQSMEPSFTSAISVFALFAALFFMALLSLYMSRLSFSRPAAAPRPQARLPGTTQGLDRIALRKLPMLPSRAGGSCAVCLGEFEDGEMLKMVPACGHAFHPFCIDHWLGARASCPLCRAAVRGPATEPSEWADTGAAGWPEAEAVELGLGLGLGLGVRKSNSWCSLGGYTGHSMQRSFSV